jgi:hypothetical protein
MALELRGDIQRNQGGDETQFGLWKSSQGCIAQNFAIGVSQDALNQVFTTVAYLCQDGLGWTK